jgi:hypothetical protein
VAGTIVQVCDRRSIDVPDDDVGLPVMIQIGDGERIGRGLAVAQPEACRE